MLNCTEALENSESTCINHYVDSDTAMTAVLLHPESNQFNRLDFTVGYFRWWLDTLSYEEKVVYYHHLKRIPVAKTAQVLNKSEVDIHKILLKSARRCGKVFDYKIKNGIDIEKAKKDYQEFCDRTKSDKEIASVLQEDYTTVKIVREFIAKLCS